MEYGSASDQMEVPRPQSRRKDPGPLRIGVIGCGWVSNEWHLPALATRNDAVVVALADVEPIRLNRLGDRFAIPRRHSTVQALVEDREVEAVAVCLPPADHAEAVVRALEAGKDVLVEKPLATSLHDCDRLAEVALRSRGILMVGFNLRWHRLVRRARAIVQDGVLGELRLVQSRFTSQAGPRVDSSWRGRRLLGGDVVTNLGVHHFDLWHFLLAVEVDEVRAMADRAQQQVAVAARLVDGTLVDSVFSDGVSVSHELSLLGTQAQLHVSIYRQAGFRLLPASGEPAGGLRGLGSRVRTAVREGADGARTTRLGGDHRASFFAEWGDFITTVRARSTPSCTVADGRRALAIEKAVWESAASGCAVSLNTGVAAMGGAG